jgi:hypothetical protein
MIIKICDAQVRLFFLIPSVSIIELLGAFFYVVGSAIFSGDINLCSLCS